MTDDGTLLRAYDEQMRGIGAPAREGLIIERDGPVLREAGQHRGFVTGPRDLGVDGPELDALIARQRDYFAARGEAVEWKTRGHDRPASLTTRLRAGRRPPPASRAADAGPDMTAPPGASAREGVPGRCAGRLTAKGATWLQPDGIP